MPVRCNICLSCNKPQDHQTLGPEVVAKCAKRGLDQKRVQEACCVYEGWTVCQRKLTFALVSQVLCIIQRSFTVGKSKVYRRAATSVSEYFRRELPSADVPVLSKTMRRIWTTYKGTAAKSVKEQREERIAMIHDQIGDLLEGYTIRRDRLYLAKDAIFSGAETPDDLFSILCSLKILLPKAKDGDFKLLHVQKSRKRANLNIETEVEVITL